MTGDKAQRGRRSLTIGMAYEAGTFTIMRLGGTPCRFTTVRSTILLLFRYGTMRWARGTDAGAGLSNLVRVKC